MECIRQNGPSEAYLVTILKNISAKVFTIQSMKISRLKINPLYGICVIVTLLMPTLFCSLIAMPR